MLKYFRKADLQSIILIVFIVNLLYFHSYKIPFHLDDFSTIVDRPLIKNLGAFFNNADGIFHNRVFLLYSFALNYKIGGLDVLGYHLINILIHSIISVLVYFLAKEIIISLSVRDGNHHKTKRQYSNVVPLLASLLFAIHPLQIESVSYISSRSTLAVSFFFLGSLLLFIKGTVFFFKPFRETKYSVYFIICFFGGFILFLLGLGFKEIIITLPFLYLVYVFLFHFEKIRELKKFLIAGSIILLCLLVHVTGYIIYHQEIEELLNINQTEKYQEESIQKVADKLKEIKKKHHPILNLLYFTNDRLNFLTNIYNSVSSRVINIYITGKSSFSPFNYSFSELEIIGLYYLKLLFFPFNQSVFPDFPVFNDSHWKTLLCSFLLIISLFTYCISSKFALVSFSFFWYIITLLPSSSIIPVTDLVSEHRTYLPNIGFFMAVSVVITSYFSNKRLAFLPFILIIIIAFSMLTLKRNYIWQNEISLWGDTVKKAPSHIKSINAFGVALVRNGQNDTAQTVFQRGLKLDPLNFNILINLGRIYRDRGNFTKAEEHFKLAALTSNNYLANINLGYIYLKKNLYYESIKEFEEALKHKSDSYLAYFYLGNAYSELKEYQKAIQHFEKSIKINPDFAETYNNLGYTFWNLRKFDQAYKWFVKAMEKQPDFPLSYKNIGNYFLLKNEKEKAEYFYKLYREKLKDNF